MRLTIQGRHLKVTKAIDDYVKLKINKVEEHFSQALHASVILETVKKNQTAEVTLASTQHYFHNKITTGDLYKSIDLLFDKMERQVRRYKENESDKAKRSDSLSSHLKEDEELDEFKAASQDKIKVIDVKIPFIPMSDLEAVLQLEKDEDKEFLAYIDEKVNKTPIFLLKKGGKLFELFSFNELWERKEIELLGGDKITTNKVEAINPPLELIEYAIEYLEHQKEENFRIFISMRTKKIMFLHREEGSIYALAREKI